MTYASLEFGMFELNLCLIKLIQPTTQIGQTSAGLRKTNGRNLIKVGKRGVWTSTTSHQFRENFEAHT